jgi:predicted O-methyltransferase YrrM
VSGWHQAIRTLRAQGARLTAAGRWLSHTTLPLSGRFTAPRRLAATLQPIPEEAVIGRVFPPYSPIFVFSGEFIDREHRAIAEMSAPDGLIRTTIPGFLRPADALVLYELAYFTPGDVLEIGSAWGLSTSILCRAVARARQGRCVSSIEKDASFQRITRQAIASLGLQCCYRGLPGDADTIVPELLAGRTQFGMIFVDHDHTYPAMHRLCEQLSQLLVPGGIALFHDFNDERNVTGPEKYGVYRAVRELVADPEMAFLGVIGCCAVMRKTTVL